MTILRLAADLEENLMFAKRLFAKDWQDLRATIRPIIRARMAKENKNCLQSALAIGKEMSAQGKDPGLVIAIATEMAKE
jgi:hypothetical protein